MDEINETLIAMAAENYADSLERRGCAYWQGLYRGYIDGYRTCEGKETPNEIPAGNCIKPDVNQQRELLLAFCDHLNTYNGMEEVRFDFMMQDFLDKSQ